MSVKIIGGVAKGFSLDIPPEKITRPTSILLRRRLFDFLQNLSGYYFMDICAGSGSIGLEAASRGANPILFVEAHESSFKILEKNVERFHEKFSHSSLSLEVTLKNMPFQKWLEQFLGFYSELDTVDQKNIILFFDPPYESKSLYDEFFAFFKKMDFKGLIIVEACSQKTMTQEKYETLYGKPTRKYRQGTSFLFLYDYN